LPETTMVCGPTPIAAMTDRDVVVSKPRERPSGTPTSAGAGELGGSKGAHTHSPLSLPWSSTNHQTQEPSASIAASVTSVALFDTTRTASSCRDRSWACTCTGPWWLASQIWRAGAFEAAWRLPKNGASNQ
jgi:hypothetical protein